MCRPASFNIPTRPISLPSSQFAASFAPPLSATVQSVDYIKSQSPTEPTPASRKHTSRHPHIVVQHHYHDHANEEECIDDRPARGGVTTPFPIRLHKMLDKMEADGHADVISWQPHGRCFVVRKPKEFKELLPTYFKLSKMSSFQRQLNLYGFQRLTRGRDKNGYYHEYFLRGKPSLSHKIQRTKVKGTGVRARSNPSTEPHLWEMTWVGTDAPSAQQNYSDNGSVSSQEDINASPKFSSPRPMVSSIGSMPPLVSSLPTSASSAFMPPLTASSSKCMPWAQQYFQEQPEMVSSASMKPMGFEDDTIMSFGGKMFHYLPPEELIKEAQMRKRQQEAVKREDEQTFMSDQELDNLYVHLDDAVVDNDDAFMDMLERVLE